MMKKQVVLASQSPRRIQLLKQIGIEPKCSFGVEADETPLKGELPKRLAARLAQKKAELASEKLESKGVDYPCFLVTADTVVGVGRRVLPKTQNINEARECMEMLSGRTHRVYTGVCVVSPELVRRTRIVETKVKFKSLGEQEIEQYINSNEWDGKAGGYAIQGMAEKFITQIIGSYSNVVGLPLYETSSLLYGLGYQD